jgi:hypothetical protein
MLKKLRLLYIYTTILKKNRQLLLDNHELSIDWIWRMYKTYTLSVDDVDNVKTYGFKYLNDLLKKEVSSIDKTFMTIGLSEYVSFMEAIELNDHQIGMAFRFKYLNTAKMFSGLLWTLFTIFFGLLGFLIFSYVGILLGLLLILIIFLISRIFL